MHIYRARVVTIMEKEESTEDLGEKKNEWEDFQIWDSREKNNPYGKIFGPVSWNN